MLEGELYNLELRKLWKLGIKAREFSYSPYSKYAVGAVLESSDGDLILGANVENISFGGTLCAERVAFAKALSSGKKNFKRILLVADEEKGVLPCGFCLQTMAEFAKSDFEIITASLSRVGKIYKFHELFPHPFESVSLNEKSL